MIRNNHYRSLRNQIDLLLLRLSEDELPEELVESISPSYYEEALASLEHRKQRLEEKEKDYKKALGKFHDAYNVVRQHWKKDFKKVSKTLAKQKG